MAAGEAAETFNRRNERTVLWARTTEAGAAASALQGKSKSLVTLSATCWLLHTIVCGWWSQKACVKVCVELFIVTLMHKVMRGWSLGWDYCSICGLTQLIKVIVDDWCLHGTCYFLLWVMLKNCSTLKHWVCYCSPSWVHLLRGCKIRPSPFFSQISWKVTKSGFAAHYFCFVFV